MITFENGKYFTYDMIGEFHSSGDWIHPKRRIKSYEVILVLEGTVYIAEEKREYVLQKNQLLLLEPFKEHYGYKTVSEPTAFYWFHFFTDLEVPIKSFNGTDIYEIKQLFKKLLHVSNTSIYSPAVSDSLGYLIFEELIRLSHEENTSNQVLAARISEYIKNNLRNGVTVSDIADHFEYNADYIGKYFKRIHGIGLKEYLAVQKIKLAKDFLLTTDMSVKQISRELGYIEENLFIKFFTYHEKISPSAFKAKYCNTHINNK